MDNFVETGIKIDGKISSELLCTIFWSGTPLHDGAVIIQGQKLSAAGCLLPLTESTEISKRLGTRHRAGVGLTEETDAVAIVVSEETGTISTGVKGVLTQGIDAKELKKFLTNSTGKALSPQGANRRDQGNIHRKPSYQTYGVCHGNCPLVVRD